MRHAPKEFPNKIEYRNKGWHNANKVTLIGNIPQGIFPYMMLKTSHLKL